MKSIRIRGLALAAVLALAFAAPVLAAGLYTNGLPAGTSPLTGNELVPGDTQLANGLTPQTESISVDVLKSYMFSNSGTATLTANGTVSATAGAATLNLGRVVVTSEALTTAAGADYTLTLTDSHILATSIVLATAANGTNTTEGLAINRVQPTAGSVVIHVRNTHASAALNGTIKIALAVIN